ncbi:hypothetical protein ANCDUO_15136 [Ancylostoma duodenale]|uniref:Uncharacterized protein n=1 Tax=Ancylostoma duodenale TaxID=51022 RepID=A0A0C2CXY5_9BILA|nr:hypothetical protein ANCDUO_15136 [Ancylostoma duodenale]
MSLTIMMEDLLTHVPNSSQFLMFDLLSMIWGISGIECLR